MKKKKNNLFRLVLIPKISAVILVISSYLFVSEIFSEKSQWNNFLYAIIPGSIYLFSSIIAWKNSGIGGALFVFLATILFFMEIIRNSAFLPMYILIGMTFLTGFLFIFFRKK